MYYIETKYKNDGFSTWVKLLRQLSVTNYHYLDLSNKVDLMFISSKCLVSEEVLISIINDLAELGEFDKSLWYENRVVWSQKLVDSIQDAYKKRNNNCMTYEGLLLLLVSLGIRKPSKSTPKGDGNTQSIVKDTKEKKRKVFVPPSQQDVIDYFIENEYTKVAAIKAFQYYDEAGWEDSQGSKVKNWKQKMIGVWFKDENKSQASKENKLVGEHGAKF